MMIKTLLASLALAVAAPALAQYASPPAPYSTYDWRSGNRYSVNPDSSGVTIRGYNAQTGSMWRQRNNSDGSYSGTDADGNYYRGNNNTGQYYNYGTGRSCYGTGALRTCY